MGRASVLITALARYARWLHLGWPAGTVEPLPEVRHDGATNVPGLRVVGDLTGIPLLKFAADTGARAVAAIAADPDFQRERERKADDVRDLCIVGAGVSGLSAALAAREAGVDFTVYEARRPFQTIHDFPKRKPIYTYPHAMEPAGRLGLHAEVKEDLVEELDRQTADIPVEQGRVERVRRAGGSFEIELAGGERVLSLRVIVAVGRSGDYRKLGVPGEETDRVFNRLHDPADFRGRRVLVVGGGDSAVESALALAGSDAEVTLAHRGAELNRPKSENLAKLHAASPPISLRLGTTVREIRAREVVLAAGTGASETVANDVVFSMIGREAPLTFLRRCGLRIAGEWNAKRVAALVAFVLFCFALYNWKSGGYLDALSREAHLFPYNLRGDVKGPGRSFAEILRISAATPSFWYTLVYSAIVVTFGLGRVRRRRTPYVRLQTLTLAAIQVLPLFLLPELILPWLDLHGLLPAALADALFPRVDYGHGREFWRAYGLILAWPLNVYNVMTDSPLWSWLAIGFVQTFVLIPTAIYFWGKGAYCGWICSCGALAETLGDRHRHKMPHGPRWNRLNLAGQAILALAVLMALVRFASWIFPQSDGLRFFSNLALSGSALSYKWTVDVFLAGVIGYGLYFWFSGRVWCRFFCPLAALMHVYARLSRFRILADKKKCISCNVCTSVCHQGIDVMSFANKGLPMADPECVRCSACVESCPTAVLAFGQVARDGAVISGERLPASPVRMREGSAGGA